MDLVKTLLIYMMLAVGAAAEASPGITPPPAASEPTARPTAQVIVLPTAIPTQAPTRVPTIMPTATPTAYTTLYVGDRGEDVKKLQRRLAELGYLTDKIDGIYGQNTKRAVERFQYYNNLKVDGIAGKNTQRELYENPRAVTAPPDITPGPTPTATPAASVIVPVYYVDQNGRLISQTSVSCSGITTIYANDNYVPSDYILISQRSYNVRVRNGVASPASVTFRYQRVESPTAPPATVTIPVYYMTDTGAILYQTAATLPTGKTSSVSVNLYLVPDYYVLASASTVNVYVDTRGTANPGSVVFSFRNATPTPEPKTKQAQIPVRYIDQQGMLLNETIVTVEYGTSMAVYASGGMVGQNYQLVSQSPVYVSVSASGWPNPAVIYFTYSYQAPTNPPTNPPTYPPTDPPTNPPTYPPTDPPTNPPTYPPTDTPTNPPTDPPYPGPETQNLSRKGRTVVVNGDSLSISWYTTDNGTTVVPLMDICQGLNYEHLGGGHFIVLGHSVQVEYHDGSIYSLTVDGSSYLSHSLVYNSLPFVDTQFLSALGVSVSYQDGSLVLSY